MRKAMSRGGTQYAAVTAELETPRLRSLGEMLDYAIVRMARSWQSLTILGVAFLILPWIPNLVLGWARSSLGLSITLLFGMLIEYVGYGACACIISPLAPPIDSKTAAVRALKRTISVVAFLVSVTFVYLIGIIIAAIPLIIYFAINAGHSNPVMLAVCVIPIVLAYIVVSVRTTLLFNVGTALIVRENVGPRTAFEECSRRFFIPGRRKLSAIVALCSMAPGFVPMAINLSLSYSFGKSVEIWQLATLPISAAAALFSLSLCITYDEDLRARFEGADLIAAAERLLPEPAAS